MNTNDAREDPAERRFAEEAGRLLRRSAASLDGATLTRLERARQGALDELDQHRPRPTRRLSGWQPALGIAAAALLAVGLWLGRGGDMTAPPVSQDLPAAFTVQGRGAGEPGDLEVLLAGEQIEMLEELEFFDWVDSGLAVPEVS